MVARFLHRSVYEFLGHHDVWDETVAKHLSPTFSIALSLFRSAILLIKTYRLSWHCDWKEILRLGVYAGNCAKSAEIETKRSHCGLVHELDLAMHGIMPLVYLTSQDSISEIPFPDRTCHWSVWCRHVMLFVTRKEEVLRPLHDTIHGSLVAFAAEYNLQYYIRS